MYICNKRLIFSVDTKFLIPGGKSYVINLSNKDQFQCMESWAGAGAGTGGLIGSTPVVCKYTTTSTMNHYWIKGNF